MESRKKSASPSKKSKKPVKITNDASKSTSRPEAQVSSFLSAFYVLLGSLPSIIIAVLCSCWFYKEYSLNNYSILNQNKFFSNVEAFDFHENLTCYENDYKRERVLFNRCAPKFCARFFSDFLLHDDETKTLLNMAQRGFSFGESSGGASVYDPISGTLSKNDGFIDIKKTLKEKNLAVHSTNELEVFKNVKNKVLNEIKTKFGIDNVYFTKPSFFSKMTNKDAKTVHDEYWHSHIDKKQYESFHYTTLIYLNNQQLDFYGGRFVFRNLKDNTTLSIEPKVGRVLTFTSGTENEHYVERVVSGERYALTIAFTCDPKFSIESDL